MNANQHNRGNVMVLAFRSLLLLGIALVARSSQAQNYSIDWHTIDSGGSACTGGVYSLSGTIGQPDAGRFNGGEYALEGGFWGILAVPTPAAPTLLLVPAGLGFATISWNPDAPGFVLQMNTTADNPAGWADAPSGSANPATVSTSGDRKFYRLNNP